jgi:hypothetical protein
MNRICIPNKDPDLVVEDPDLYSEYGSRSDPASSKFTKLFTFFLMLKS